MDFNFSIKLIIQLENLNCLRLNMRETCIEQFHGMEVKCFANPTL